jgi:hypothetical protein
LSLSLSLHVRTTICVDLRGLLRNCLHNNSSLPIIFAKVREHVLNSTTHLIRVHLSPSGYLGEWVAENLILKIHSKYKHLRAHGHLSVSRFLLSQRSAYVLYYPYLTWSFLLA